MALSKKVLFANWNASNGSSPMGSGPVVFVTALVTISASETTICLVSLIPAFKKGSPVKRCTESITVVAKLLANKDENFPSSNTATGI